MNREKDNLAFIKDDVLQKNIEHVHNDISGLATMVPYAEPEMQNCLRKTIIIYAASIVEALLLWKIKKKFGKKDLLMRDEWKYHTIKVIHADDNFEVIGAKRKRETRNADRLDFNRMIILCKNENILDKDTLKNLDEIRKLRNKLHIGGLKTITKTHPRKDVEFAVRILKETIQEIA